MKKLAVCLSSVVFVLAVHVSAAETFKGTISDASCAAKHSAEKHGGNATKHEDCVKKCVDGGAAYVFLSGDKIYKIANQDFAELKAHAGREVNLTGELKGESITISKLETPKK
jgi:hypothetical protein